MGIERRTQLSVYLENRPGALAEVSRLIDERQINLIAICAIDTVEEAVLRMVPADAARAQQALDDANIRALATEVLLVELDNDPGAMTRVAGKLAAGNVNIDYVYASAHPDCERVLLVLRTHQMDEAQSVLA